ncbi:10315_t:CDS:1, partial [Dentiscutata erythropus]
ERVKEKERQRVGGREYEEVEEGRGKWRGGCESWEVGVEWGSEIAKRVKKQRNLERRERR